jgi:hypothetical protein
MKEGWCQCLDWIGLAQDIVQLRAINKSLMISRDLESNRHFISAIIFWLTKRDYETQPYFS